MCVAIYKPASQLLTYDRLKICSINNPDGGGFAYIENGNIVIKKGYFDFEKFWADFDAVQATSPCLVHFRISTAGLKDEHNCHPWRVNDELVFIHNGTISDFQTKDGTQSDTGNFNEHILFTLAQLGGSKFFLNPPLQYLLYKAIGDTNKLVFLDNQGTVQIFNELKGFWADGAWYSNDSFKDVKAKYTNNKNTNTNPASSSPINYVERRNHKRMRVTRCKSKGVFSTQPYAHTVGKLGAQLWSYVMPNDNKLLTQEQVNALVTEHRDKLKHLVDRNIVIRVPVNEKGQIVNSGQADVDAWLANRPEQPEILASSIMS